MKKHIITFAAFAALLLASTPFAAANTPFIRHFAWTQDTSVPGTYQARAEAGEGVRLTVQIRHNGALPRIPDGATAALYWQTNGMASAAWWTATASVSALGVIDTVFPASPEGRYSALLSVEHENARIYAARALITITHSPGPAPNTLVPPVPTLDFATTKILNPEAAPFLMPGDLPILPDFPDFGALATTNDLAALQPKIIAFQGAPTTVEVAVNTANNAAGNAQNTANSAINQLKYIPQGIKIQQEETWASTMLEPFDSAGNVYGLVNIEVSGNGNLEQIK